MRLFVALVVCAALASAANLPIDDTLGRRFDGIGGLSGGGATSRLLYDYEEPFRSQVLDYLFTPNFGANLQMLKVEIGGDGQSTDGTEPSHMHTATDENYARGYEWWLLKEAKKRNPNIVTAALSWAFPAWVGNGSGSPYKFPENTAMYTIKWLSAAHKLYNITIDYVGVWNEKFYDATYIKVLRKRLDENGFQKTQIVANDGLFIEICINMNLDKELLQAVSVVGAHYPGTVADSNCFTPAMVQRGVQAWASEDYSTYADYIGAGCWARILNQNYVNGNMTSTIAWNLIAAYDPYLPYKGDGLMFAYYPWTGHYDVQPPIWVTAHTTQFTQPGWFYLKQGHGAGALPKGGSYVTFVDPNKNDITMVIETMTHDHSVCIRPPLLPFTVEKQTVTFELGGSLKAKWAGKRLALWLTHLTKHEKDGVLFQQQQDVTINADGTFTMTLDVDSVFTISSVRTAKHGGYSDSPLAQAFPSEYDDDFDSYPVETEAKYFADQTGSWQIVDSHDAQHGKVMRQTVPTFPINWCEDAKNPVSTMGNYEWADVDVSVEVMIEKQGKAGVASRIAYGGCGVGHAPGVYLWLEASGKWSLTTELDGAAKVSGQVHNAPGEWHKLAISVRDDLAVGYIDDKEIFSQEVILSRGFVGIISSFDYTQFDRFSVVNALTDRVQCALMQENWPQETDYMVLTCPTAAPTIHSINFASFGTPQGVCGHLTHNPKCHAVNSTEIVSSLCLNKHTCTIPIDLGVFGDPCKGQTKYLGVEVTCE